MERKAKVKDTPEARHAERGRGVTSGKSAFKQRIRLRRGRRQIDIAIERRRLCGIKHALLRLIDIASTAGSAASCGRARESSGGVKARMSELVVYLSCLQGLQHSPAASSCTESWRASSKERHHGRTLGVNDFSNRQAHVAGRCIS